MGGVRCRWMATSLTDRWEDGHTDIYPFARPRSALWRYGEPADSRAISKSAPATPIDLNTFRISTYRTEINSQLIVSSPSTKFIFSFGRFRPIRVGKNRFFFANADCGWRAVSGSSNMRMPFELKMVKWGTWPALCFLLMTMSSGVPLAV